MKKTLFLMRHAQALSSTGGGDIQRELSPTGLDDAAELGNFMCAHNYHPDLVLCSAAIRTRQTFEKLCSVYDALDVNYSENIYTASYNDLLDIARRAPENVESLMIIGHNPAIYEFAAKLSNEGADRLLQRLSQGFPPASFCAIEIPHESWAALEYNNNTLIELVNPQDYNAPDTPARWT